MFKELLVLHVCFIAAAFYGLDATMMKLSEVQNPLILAGIRLSSTLVFLALLLRRLPKIRSNILFIGAIFSSVLSSLLFISALELIPVADVLLLFYGSMIWSCLWKWLSGNAVSRLDFFTAFLVFIGNGILLYQPHVRENIWGYILGIIAGASFAGFLFLTQEIKRKDPNDTWVHFDAFAFAILIIIITSSSYVAFNRYLLPTSGQISILICSGALYGFAYCLLFRVLGMAPAHIVNTYFGAFEPFLGIMIAYIVLGEEIRGHIYAGLFMITTPIIIRGAILYCTIDAKLRKKVH